MTETQAKSGTAGASTNPVEGDAGGASATGRAAVGRAAVPADAPQPKFTRAPGMVPPPDNAGDGDNGSSPDENSDSGAGGQPSVPVGASAGAATSASAAPGPATSGVSVPGVSASAGTPPTITRPGVSRPGDGPARPGDAGASATATRPGAAAGSAAPASASAVGAARVTEAVRTARSTVAGGSSRGPRRARLNVKRIDPWSVFKFSFAVSLVLFIVVIVATSVLYLALDAMGVFEKVNTSLGDLISASGGSEGSTFKITAKGVIGTSALIGVVNVVLFTALATLGAFIYNVCADLVGGVELTLAERD
jgi:hypothetical protein